MLISYIIQVLLFITHQLNLLILFFFLINTFFPPLWMVDAKFILILLFILSYFCSVWHTFSCFILRMVYLVLFCVTFSLGPTHFPSCSSHTVNTSFSKFLHPECSCTRNLAHNAINACSQSLLHQKCTCTRPVQQMPFGDHNIED